MGQIKFSGTVGAFVSNAYAARAHTAGLTNEEKRDAVVTAALDWFSERAIKDWSEAYLAHAIISMEGDWPGCEGCDFECDEPCTPATESEQHHAIDCCIAQRVHDGKLVKPMDYEPPEGWKPIVMRPKRNIEAEISRLLDATQAERDALRAEVERLRGALTGVLSSNPEGLSSNPRAALKGGA